MPLDNFITRPDFSRQIKQFSSTTAELGGSTRIAEDLFVKNIEIDTLNGALNPINGDVLVFDGTRFLPGVASQYGNVIINGMLLSYYTGLTYNVTQGEYRMNGINYQYTGGSVTIASGNSLYNRFDVVYVTGDTFSITLLLSGTASITPTIPSLFSNQLQVGVISVPANFTGGTGTTVIQTTSATVFEYYLGTNTGIQRASPNNALASGSFSFALSRDSRAYGLDSAALGLGTEASGNSQTVVGQYNIPSSDGYFIVGNGTGSTSRSNAFRVTTGGSAYVTNKLFVTNVEIETTGASSNYALIHDGNKFTPQLLTLQKITESGNTTNNSIKVGQISATSIFLSSGFTFISGYNSYSNPSELRVLLADDLGSQESQTDTYQLNYFTENVTKGINSLTTGAYSAFTGGPIFGYVRTGTSITVGKESFVKITGITSGDTVIGTVFRNRFETKNYNANNGVDDTTKNLVGTAFFNQINSTKSNQTPFVGTLLETHLLGNQQATFHNEIRNLQLGVFNRAWVYATSAQSLFDLYINRPTVSKDGYNSFSGTTSGGQTLRLNKHAGIFIESREKISLSDVLNRTLNNLPSTVIFENKPWSLFAEADRAYIGNTLVLASAQTLASTTRGAWLDIGASQATRPHINLSAGTDPSSPQIGDLWWNGTELYFRKDASTSVNLLSGGTGSITSGSGTTSGTSLGNGVKVLFSSNTTTLSFATLSSLTPSTLSIISSSTGVILFSAVTGSGGTGSTLTGDYLPLSGGTLTGGLSGTSITATTFYGDASNLTGVLSKTLLSANIPVTSQVAQVNTFFLYDKLTITASTSAETVTSITSNVSISAYTPSIKFFANTGVTVTFRNSTVLKTEGGLDAVIVGDNYDSITFTYNNNIQKYFQTNINNYI